MGQLALFEFTTPKMPVLDVSRCYVKPVNHLTASNMVTQYHYAHRCPSIVAAFGMYVDDVLAGVITYGMPSAPQLKVCGSKHAKNQLELTRLFVFDWCGKNSESWFIGKTFNELRAKFPEYYILVSYADKGQNHQGYIYQATNWIYTGLSVPGGTASNIWVNGERMSSKNAYDRWGTQGVKELRLMGLEVIKGKRTFKHRYVYFLGDKRQRKHLHKALKWEVLPYPKADAS